MEGRGGKNRKDDLEKKNDKGNRGKEGRKMEIANGRVSYKDISVVID